ncbi:hypothetical protein BB558_001636 [Smittium angustum]|uniref:FLYWCH-type domain-containing protein n=1 Tax=Smittium angustum TaxID=133377 RepID=A0A2U1JB93_SMIAN|nr:hypothetical protein BB558_001636 [Smittium angustum]
MSAQLIPNTKNGFNLSYGGYIYNNQGLNNKNEKAYWLCTNDDCTGRAISYGETPLVSPTIEHSHKQDYEAVNVETVLAKIRKMARENTLSPEDYTLVSSTLTSSLDIRIDRLAPVRTNMRSADYSIMGRNTRYVHSFGMEWFRNTPGMNAK